MASGYYPAGAEHDPNAPYNQCDPPEVEVELTMSETLTKTVPHWTNKVWRVYDEEGYGSWESDGFDPNEEWTQNYWTLEQTLQLALEEITAVRAEAERQQRQLEEHYGVRHNTIPGYFHPTEFEIKRRQQLSDAMDRVRHLRALEDALKDWEYEDREVEFNVD